MNLAGVALLLAGLAFILDRTFPLPLDRVAARSTLVAAADGSLLRAFTTPDGAWRLSATRADVDPRYLRLLVAAEDQRFDRHPGIDPLAILRAAGQALGAGRIVSGASTLTMQTARLIEPRPRTLGAKLVEMGRALQLEWHLGKERVLDLYLTLAPFGGNLEGVRAASLFYFGKEPRVLTDAEAALLVSLPQSPERRRPDRFPDVARAERDRLLARLAEDGALNAAAAREAMQEPVPTARLVAPLLAPHLAERLRRDDPTAERIATTIEPKLQAALQALAARTQGTLEPGATLALLAVRNADRAVIAHVGSGGYLDEGRRGAIDLTRAIRSPGSALKPFIYGLGFDDLVVHPETMVDDVAQRFGGYRPQNFDRIFRGQITVREALQKSLNIPAVAVLDRVGPIRFANALAEVGAPLTMPRDAGEPGLPIALGGVGFTLDRLVTLYAGLAEHGTVRPLRERADAVLGVGESLMSPVAAWYLARILQDTAPPPDLLPGQFTASGRAIAFKTGTSYGFRDAWAVGFDPEYTIGVWVGRPDGGFSSGRLGRLAAGPVLFEAFGLLPRPGAAALAGWPRPEGALEVGNTALPPALRHLAPARANLEAMFQASDAPRIAFPVADSRVELRQQGDRLATLVLRADRGRLPLRWLVNGQPVPASPYRRQAEWLPDGAGFARVTVIDADGRMASAQFRMERPR
ncbi:penicillin-binding protein 1C [Zavarzinia sp. CC-PAN008]|uniref:penicillin-binding protein 1C n=1 Tax=Zavarzinia sp. CC-PAN008 TaxID=3243332 RepID=UPI003F749895